jgi:glycosyltransferase involved in cell wall biosynthesis
MTTVICGLLLGTGADLSRSSVSISAAVPAPVTILVDEFPVLSETFVANEAAALAACGHRVRIEAGVRGGGPQRDDVPRADVIAEDAPGARLWAMAQLVLRHPVRCLSDTLARRRWSAQETPRRLRELALPALRIRAAGSTHLHAHFAAGAALDALRLSALLGIPYSVTAHAYDIYALPRNLREKLERAAFATSGCDYTVRDLRRLAPAADVHEIVMGVDLGVFTRGGPLPGGRAVVAVGRLVEKKGFATLVEAAALLAEGPDALARVVIVGEGPERDDLERRVAERGLQQIVQLTGALEPSAVVAAIEAADVLAAPCVIAASGDRDSAPLVVKEALAMERLVVASNEVGLPEFVKEPWGRLHPPGDAAALAAALQAALALGTVEREQAGASGRAYMAQAADVHREAQRLSTLIAQAGR